MYKLCRAFGIKPSSLSEWLDYSLEILWGVIREPSYEAFGIVWPTAAELKESRQVLQTYRPYRYALRGLLGVTDGARFKYVSFDDMDAQNAYLQAFTQQVQVTNLLVWNFKGEIIQAALNYSGSWHDSKLPYVSALYWHSLKGDTITPPGYAIIRDSAFDNNTRVKTGKVLRARKLNEMKTIPKPDECAAIDLLLQLLYLSERQSAE